MRKLRRWSGLFLVGILLTGCGKADPDYTGLEERLDAMDRKLETIESALEISEDAEDMESYTENSVSEEDFRSDLQVSEIGDLVFTVENISSQDYYYLSADILFYNGDNQMLSVSSASFWGLIAGSKQVCRMEPTGLWDGFDHFEIFYTGGTIAEENVVDVSGIRIQDNISSVNNEIIAKCVNETGKMVDNVYFLVSYYQGDSLVATSTAEYGNLQDKKVFLLCVSGPYDGWYNDLPYDSYQLEVLKVISRE